MQSSLFNLAVRPELAEGNSKNRSRGTVFTDNEVVHRLNGNNIGEGEDFRLSQLIVLLLTVVLADQQQLSAIWGCETSDYTDCS